MLSRRPWGATEGFLAWRAVWSDLGKITLAGGMNCLGKEISGRGRKQRDQLGRHYNPLVKMMAGVEPLYGLLHL